MRARGHDYAGCGYPSKAGCVDSPHSRSIETCQAEVYSNCSLGSRIKKRVFQQSTRLQPLLLYQRPHSQLSY